VVCNEAPVKNDRLSEEELEPEFKLELSCAFAAIAKRQPYGRSREQSMVTTLMLLVSRCSDQPERNSSE
jgi:hypothetical protein